MTDRQRILLVTRNLPPLVGGMERLNWHMAAELAKVADVRIIGPQGSAAHAPPGIEVREAPLNPLRKFLWRARALARCEARAWRPDIVLAGSGLTAPIARSAARVCGARCAVYVHGLDVAVRNVVYRALWLPAIRKADRVIANSRATAALCRGIGVNPARIGIVHPGVDLPQDLASSPPAGHSGAGPQGRNPESSSGAPDQPEAWIPGSARVTRGQPRNDEMTLVAAEPAAVEPLSLRESGRGEGSGSHGTTRHATPPNLQTSLAGHSVAGPQGPNPESVSSTHAGHSGAGPQGLNPESVSSTHAGHSGADPQGRNPEPVSSTHAGHSGAGPQGWNPESGSSTHAGHSGAGPQGWNPESVSSTDADTRRSTFRQRHGLGDRPLLLSVGRLSTRKGLREFVTQSLPRIVAARPDAMLLIVGDAPKQALHAEAQSPASIQSAADAAGVGDQIKFLGVITDYAELGAVYRAADVHVFPVRKIPGDPEGFGMVAVEAAAHGLPTVAFAAGGVVDAVAEGRSGHLVPPGDYPALADAVIATLGERETLRAPCIAFARQFAWLSFGARVAQQLGLA